VNWLGLAALAAALLIMHARDEVSSVDRRWTFVVDFREALHLSEDNALQKSRPTYLRAREDKPLEGDISGLHHLVQPCRQKWGRRDGAHFTVSIWEILSRVPLS
jgi:hypothetical protein